MNLFQRFRNLLQKDTTSTKYFEAKYRKSADPWNFASSSYEGGRYEAMLAVLEKERYGRAFEPGCSVGVLTQRLAPLCDRVEAMDISPTAVAQAQARCKDLPNVTIRCGALPGDIPQGSFDLVVLSEIGYYFTEEQLTVLGRQLIERIRPSGTLLATHWLGHSKDHLLTGDRVHEIMEAMPGLAIERSERHTGFRLDRWKRQ